jgi:putative sterol carrier protein
MTNKEIEKVLEQLPEHFIPEKAGKLDLVAQLNITGDEPGEWIITIKNKQCSVSAGVANDASLKLTMDGMDFIDLIEGRLDPTQAYMQGRIKFEGNMLKAMRIVNLFTK